MQPDEYKVVLPRILDKPKAVGEVNFIVDGEIKRNKIIVTTIGYFDTSNNKVYEFQLTITHGKRI